MRSFVTLTALASVATMVAATAHPLFEYPETVPLAKRQEPGTPQYACHENCGLAITFSRQDGYCSNDEWKTRYDACMVCANTYNIWQYYSNSVSKAATGCGLTASPSPSGGAAATTAASSPSETAAEPATTSTSAAAPPASSSAAAASSTAAGAPATTLTTAASSAASGAATPSASSSAAGTSKATVTRATSIGTSVVIPSGTPTSTVVFAGAARNAGAFGAVGVVGLVLAVL